LEKFDELGKELQIGLFGDQLDREPFPTQWDKIVKGALHPVVDEAVMFWIRNTDDPR
jgi:hypothetical protein